MHKPIEITFFKPARGRTLFTTPIEEYKRQYIKLVKVNHPDKGGDLATMQRINAEYDELKARVYNIHEGANGEVYTDHKQDVYTDIDERFAEIIDQLIRMDGVGIEICGSFVWISGNTYDYRAELKAMGARWASKKKMWYIAPSDWKRNGCRGHSMDEIRTKHGSQVIREGATSKRPTRKAIAA